MGLVIVFVNTIIHSIMYSYYFFSSFKKVSRFTNILKPLLTMLQIVQLLIIVIHCVIALLPSCNGSKLFILMLVHVFILIIMFSRFFIKSYLKKFD